jgi:hypothetical protein
MPVKKPVDVGCAPELVVVGRISWPRVEVLSWKEMSQFMVPNARSAKYKERGMGAGGERIERHTVIIA